MIKKLLKKAVSDRQEQRRAELYRNLIRHEAKIGGTIFGSVPKGVRREFFCLDRHAWIWHEEWVDASGAHQAVTTRYSVRPDGIIKTQDGITYQAVLPAEAKRLYQAAQAYENKVNGELYQAVA